MIDFNSLYLVKGYSGLLYMKQKERNSIFQARSASKLDTLLRSSCRLKQVRG